MATQALGDVTVATNTTPDDYIVITRGRTVLKVPSTLAGTLSTGVIQGTQFKLSSLNTAPESSTAPGTTGEVRFTSGYIYLCVATNTWQRAALATW